MGGTCISRRFHIGYVNSRRMCVVGLDWQPTTPTRRRELSHTPAYYVIWPIPEGTLVILYENAPCAPVPCAWPLSSFSFLQGGAEPCHPLRTFHRTNALHALPNIPPRQTVNSFFLFLLFLSRRVENSDSSHFSYRQTYAWNRMRESSFISHILYKEHTVYDLAEIVVQYSKIFIRKSSMSAF